MNLKMLFSLFLHLIFENKITDFFLHLIFENKITDLATN